MEKMILKTNKRLECINITSRVVQLCQGKIEDGIILLYIPHTTAGIFINENTDPDVVTDFENTLSKIGYNIWICIFIYKYSSSSMWNI